MLKLETTEKYRCDTEDEAKVSMDEIRLDASTKGYEIKKMGYELKQKKLKGEIVDEAYVITVTKKFSTVFDI